MGTWGSGPFSNDHALDWLAMNMTEPVVAEIDEFAAMTDPALEIDLPIAYAALGTLNILQKANVVPPKKEQINRWKEAFFRCYDEQVDAVAGAETPFAKEWRAAIEEEFDKLSAWSQRFYT
jgi:hypothetical protein